MADKREAEVKEEEQAAGKRQRTAMPTCTQPTQLLPFLVPRAAEEAQLEDRAVTVKELYLPALREAAGQDDGDWVCVGHDVAAGEDLLLQLTDKEWEAVEDLSAVQHGAMLHALQVRLDASLNAWELRVIVRVLIWDDENEERASILRALNLPLGPDLARIDRVRRVPAAGRQLLQRWVRGKVPAGEEPVMTGFVRTYRDMLGGLAELEPLCRCLEGKGTQEEVARMEEAVLKHGALLRRLRDMVLRKTHAVRDVCFW